MHKFTIAFTLGLATKEAKGIQQKGNNMSLQFKIY